MSQTKEKEMISVFQRIAGNSEEISLFQLKNSFLPHKFRFHVYRTSADAREMFAKLVELFDKLNLSVKKKDTLNLDDFLYLMDNFAFFLNSEDEFLRLLGSCFK